MDRYGIEWPINGMSTLFSDRPNLNPAMIQWYNHGNKTRHYRLTIQRNWFSCGIYRIDTNGSSELWHHLPCGNILLCGWGKNISKLPSHQLTIRLGPIFFHSTSVEPECLLLKSNEMTVKNCQPNRKGVVNPMKNRPQLISDCGLGIPGQKLIWDVWTVHGPPQHLKGISTEDAEIL